MGEVANLISKYGFPIVAAVGMGYMIYFIYKWVTTEIKPVIGQANNTLIALIDRIRMLDNDLIRLNQKVETVLQLRGKVLEHERILADKQINQLVEDVPIGPKRKATSKEIKDASGDD
jgi:hypothetical protein